MSKNYVKDFGICELSEEEEDFLISTNSIEDRNKFLIEKYALDFYP